MRYFGGKARLAKDLAKVINTFSVSSYHEPFCGMFNVGSQVIIPRRSGADTHPDLILLLNAVRDGWNGPEVVSEEDYSLLKNAEPSPVRAFVGFGCSNSGKFFGGYARESTSRNFANNARSSLGNLRAKIQGVTFCQQSYDEYDGDAELLYCDPPYAGTTGFTVGAFDSAAFWKWVKKRARKSIVLVSEYVGPDWAKPIWEKPVKTDMNAKEGGKLSRVEKLFAVGI